MQINVATRLPRTAENACQLVFLNADGKLKGAARKIDSESQGRIKALFASGDFSGKNAETLMLHGLAGTPASRVLLVGLGDRAAGAASLWRTASKAASKALLASPATLAISDCLNTVSMDGISAPAMAEQLAIDIVGSSYVFTLHTRSNMPAQASLNEVILSTDKARLEAVSEAVDRGQSTAAGMSVARDLGNLAPNTCTPSYLADQALALADEHENLATTIVSEEEMESLGMGAFLAVSRGSRQPGKLIVMEYQGRPKAGKPIVFIGKGVTFDTGGISIKSSEGMDEMKYDMCGAASVFGVMNAVAMLGLPLNVIGIVAAAENMPDGDACRPGDVVTSMSGQTIEILNTDAEGRLVLCDALTYAERFKPDTVVDMATLTGACIVALGKVASAVLGNDQNTINALLSAGEQTGDRCWSLPLWDEYQSQLDSNFADMANIGGRPAGTITAACFLSRFAKQFNWAHLDIAGTAWNSGKEKGATGRPVPLLMQFLYNRLD
ncbi:leucyl aminopeptidase [Granulosicoccus antarcticus]|uniref:Probable cytosol aminopeptidase n=1 Tax=Granulosicoccus antarcticus IMCC3135 TaxID=1192854 RepID=A0A2Z2NU09_9GAMM|nr:leucyl aminopeptidase [Granulosicoccus antarcticus]ASJ75052.1 Cytosol aminopeptidase [Granulosicoccus antarcticus IMCC3135]